MSWFAQNIFNVGFSTYCSGDIPETISCGINIQAYLGREANMLAYNTEPQFMSAYIKDKNSPQDIELPIEKFLANKDEIESYKQLTSISIE